MHHHLPAAVFAAETDTHVVDVPRHVRYAHFAAGFDADAYLARLSDQGIAWVDRDDPGFPVLLRQTHDCPLGLFVRGAYSLMSLNAVRCVAVVGARACSSYGSEVATKLAGELSAAGVVVVSGLARGIDAAAHRAAVGHAQVAVLGCGIDRDYPRAHAELASRIVGGGGMIVSEYAPGVVPMPWRFPARNRIIAGMCEATVVVEARERSGALITADLALDENRTVLAVPGEITSFLSKGTNGLIRGGAGAVTCTADVLEEIGVEVVAAS